MVDGLYQISQCWLTASERSVHFFLFFFFYNVSVSHSTHIVGTGSRGEVEKEGFQARVKGLEIHWGAENHQLHSHPEQTWGTGSCLSLLSTMFISLDTVLLEQSYKSYGLQK